METVVGTGIYKGFIIKKILPNILASLTKSKVSEDPMKWRLKIKVVLFFLHLDL